MFSRCSFLTATTILLLATTMSPAADEPRDLLGRPLPWGPEADSISLCLVMPRTRLVYGEPIAFKLWARKTSAVPPLVRLHLHDEPRNAHLELTTDHGEAVPFTLQNLGTPALQSLSRGDPRAASFLHSCISEYACPALPFLVERRGMGGTPGSEGQDGTRLDERVRVRSYPHNSRVRK